MTAEFDREENGPITAEDAAKAESIAKMRRARMEEHQDRLAEYERRAGKTALVLSWIIYVVVFVVMCCFTDVNGGIVLWTAVSAWSVSYATIMLVQSIQTPYKP